MRVRFRKSPEGQPHVIQCTRDDGSETYGPIPGQPGVPHDLIHYAVEKTLGLTRAFFGLVAAGTAIPDAADAWKTLDARTREEASRAELVVAWFQRPAARMPSVPASEEELARIEAFIAELAAAWDALAPKQALELTWP
jgi:hypothetical protein